MKESVRRAAHDVHANNVKIIVFLCITPPLSLTEGRAKYGFASIEGVEPTLLLPVQDNRPRC
jgi:hypothetical protein